MEYSCIHNHQSQFIEWFGDVEYIPLKNVCLRIGEYGSNTPATDYDGSVRYLRITDINDDGSLGNEIVSPSTIEEKYYLQTNDFVFARTGNTVGKTYLHTSGKMIYAGYLIRYKLDETCVLPKFLLAYTHTSLFWDWVSKMKKVGAQPNISAQQYNELPIPRAEIASQQRFVSIAEQADKSKFDGFKSQFLEWFGNVTETTSLSSLIAESYPGEWGKEAKNNNGVKVLRTTNFQNNGHIDYSDVIVRYIEQKKIEKKCLRTGDIILERSGGTKDNPVGRVVLFEAEGEYMFNNFTQLLRPIKSVNPYYLFFYLHTSYNADKASMRAMASQTTGIQNLNMTDYMAKEIPLPSLEEQEQFERLYRQADKSKYYEINETSYGIL